MSSCCFAFAACLWGANAGYAFGALVLGARLREVSPAIKRVLLHTDDVPNNYLEALGHDGLWELRLVDYIDGVEDLYISKGSVFDGVFTKLSVWKLVEYDKVLLLDLDIIPCKSLAELFEMRCPAALIRGQGERSHGQNIDGKHFFRGANCPDNPWGQGGGINAGVILLQPDMTIFTQMLAEVTCKNHPCHVAGAGPEQDYLSRFFAARKDGWYHINVVWNYQLHHVPYSLERLLEWYRLLQDGQNEITDAHRAWLPERLRLAVEDLGAVHFSGDFKLWHMLLETPDTQDMRRSVDHVISVRLCDGEDEKFAHRMLSSSVAYLRWISPTDSAEDYDNYHCRLDESRILVGTEDVTALVNRTSNHLIAVATHAIKIWRQCAQKVLEQQPGVLDSLLMPQVPQGCLKHGTRVEVSWQMGSRTLWLEASVLAVHVAGTYVIKYDQRGHWGDTERHVSQSHARLRETDLLHSVTSVAANLQQTSLSCWEGFVNCFNVWQSS